MRGLIRAIMTVVLAAGLWTATAPTAKADVETLMVPSAAMGRDIPVAFQGGGPHMVVLLDAFNAAPDVSNWVTAGNAMNTLAGKGISVAAPASGAWSLYTNWEQDGSRQWETFLADELPNWMAANKGLAPSGHGIVGAAQGGTGALTHGDVPSGPLPLRRLAVGFPDPVQHELERRDHRRAGAVRRRRHAQHVGTATAGPVEVARPGRARAAAGRQQHPAVGVQPVHSGVQRSRRDDRLLRHGAGQQPGRSISTTARSAATTGTSTSPTAANHDWGSWSGQLAAMSGELVATIK